MKYKAGKGALLGFHLFERLLKHVSIPPVPYIQQYVILCLDQILWAYCPLCAINEIGKGRIAGLSSAIVSTWIQKWAIAAAWQEFL